MLKCIYYVGVDLYTEVMAWLSLLLLSFSCMSIAELSPKVVATAFWKGEVENELRRIGMVDFKFKMDDEYEKCMEIIDKLRRDTIYFHPPSDCHEDCKMRG